MEFDTVPMFEYFFCIIILLDIRKIHSSILYILPHIIFKFLITIIVIIAMCRKGKLFAVSIIRGRVV